MHEGKVLTTIPGNLLLKIFGKDGGFVYITKDGELLISPSEIELGKPIHDIEWNRLMNKSQQTPRMATVEEVEMGLAAIKKRKDEFLVLKNTLERIEWAQKNCPKKAVGENHQSTNELITKNNSEIVPNTPFAQLLPTLRA